MSVSSDAGVATVCILAILAFHDEIATDVNQFTGDVVLGLDVHEGWRAIGVDHFDEAGRCAGALAALGARVAIGARAGGSLVIVPG